MTPAEVLQQARYLTKTSTLDGVGAESDLLRIFNDVYNRQVMIFVNTNEDLFGVRASTNINTVANQEAYALPSDCIRVKRVEISYDGSPQNWKKPRYQDAGQVESFALSPININNYYSVANPYYDIFGNYIYVRPIPLTSVSGGLFLWYIKRQDPITNISTDTINTPADFHGYLAYGVAGEIATRQGNDALAASMFQKWEDGRIKVENQFPPLDLDRQLDFQPYPVDYS